MQQIKKLPKLNSRSFFYPNGETIILSEEQLKIFMLIRYLSKNDYENNTDIWKSNIRRKIIKSELIDNYGNISTTIYSLEGSPPKCRCIYIKDYDHGYIFFINNDKISKKYFCNIIC